MEKITEKLQDFFANLASSGNLGRYALLALFLIVGSILIGSIGKFVFGKRSLLGTAVSSSIAIVFLYALTAVLLTIGGKYARLTAPLPFVNADETQMSFFAFSGASFTDICGHLLNMIILAFVVNLADRFLPRGKNFFIWLLFRVLTVCFGLIAHLIVTQLIWRYLPEGITQYAPVILLGILALMLLTGALKIIVGVAISTVNPIIGAIYTFFFANIVGRQITRSVITAVIVCLLVVLLEKLGISAVSLSSVGLIVYIPCGACLLGLWYLVNRFF